MALSDTALITAIQAKAFIQKDHASSLTVYAEHVGTGDGANKEFTLDNTPVTGSLRLYVDGTLQTETTHYTISTATITFITAPGDGKQVTAAYEYAASDDTFESYDDDILEIIINAATKKCEDYAKRAYINRDITESRVGDGGNHLLLNKRPVNSISSITIQASGASDASTLTENTNFTLHKEGGYLTRPMGQSFWTTDLLSLCWTKDAKIEITYNAGYSSTRAAVQDLVPDAVMAVLITTAVWYENRLSLKSQNISGVGSIDYGAIGELPEQAKKLLGGIDVTLGIA